jgi:hypothetical protein
MAMSNRNIGGPKWPGVRKRAAPALTAGLMLKTSQLRRTYSARDGHSGKFD